MATSVKPDVQFAAVRIIANRTSVAVAAGLLCLLAVVPIVLVRFPPINDYPFHLARIVILSHLNDPIFSRFYTHGSLLLPNIALDAFAIPLAHIVGAEAAVRVFLALIPLVMFTGAIALHRAAHKRYSFWPLLSFALLYNGILRFGFLNYLFGLGLAFIAAAIWLLMRPGIARLCVAFIASVVLLFCHLESFGLFALIAAGCELAVGGTQWRTQGAARAIRALAISSLPFVLGFLLFVLLSPTAKAPGPISYAPGFLTKPLGGLFSLSSGVFWLDALTFLTLVGLLVWLWRARALMLSKRLAVASVLVLAAWLVLPDTAIGALYVDSRLGPAIAFLVLIAFDVRAEAKVAQLALLAASVLIALVRTVALSAAWLSDQNAITPIISAFERIEPGSALFAVTSDPYTKLIASTADERRAWNPPLEHVASYAVLHAPVFVPMVFAEPTQQPLVVKPAFAPLYRYQGSNPDILSGRPALSAYATRLVTASAREHWPKVNSIYILAVGKGLSGVRGELADFEVVAPEANFVLLRQRSTPPAPHLGKCSPMDHSKLIVNQENITKLCL